MGAICRTEYGEGMSRKSGPPRLIRDRKRPKDGNCYIYWTERGRSRERSCGTADREEAELVFAEWKLTRQCPERAVDPRQFNITDAISHYLTNRMDRVVDPERLGNAAKPITLLKTLYGYLIFRIVTRFHTSILSLVSKCSSHPP